MSEKRGRNSKTDCPGELYIRRSTGQGRVRTSSAGFEVLLYVRDINKRAVLSADSKSLLPLDSHIREYQIEQAYSIFR